MTDLWVGTANETCLCPSCDHETAIEDVELIPHDTLPIQIPVGRCWTCGFIWSGVKAEIVIEEFVRSTR